MLPISVFFFENRRWTSIKYIGSCRATQRVSTTVSTFSLSPIYFRSDNEDEDNVPIKGAVREAVHDVKVKDVESTDILGPLHQFHQSVHKLSIIQ